MSQKHASKPPQAGGHRPAHKHTNDPNARFWRLLGAVFLAAAALYAFVQFR